MEKLIKIQSKLKAPKGQLNSFGGYKYRSCEDILEAVKPLLAEEGLLLVLSDEIVAVGDRVYVKATAHLYGDKDEKVTVFAYARECQSRKGMDESQITGATSSYARKYVLSGLFLLDDTKDADTQDNTPQYLTDEQQSELADLMADAEVDANKFFNHFGAEGLAKFPASEFSRAKIAIETKKKKNAAKEIK